MNWLYLGGAIMLEVIATSAMKMSDGLTRPGPVVVVVLGYLAAFALLAQALKTMEVGIAYAIWSAAGTAAIAAIGVLIFGETVSLMKLLGLALIVAGVISLHAAGGHA
ncbi:DMT family transporter [Azospirillum doebereinerae]|uniref:DMT family transporter n=1 Tax=Azospirillum doebereinerae TaxID=92933 RepID=UPI001EE61E53|nr:multidrug efflux SMR transporter [Azospirillum doebereinerae]MCG5239344.1 multidrug efflux SMR transporter [Azospirillum doebereinerae]